MLLRRLQGQSKYTCKYTWIVDGKKKQKVKRQSNIANVTKAPGGFEPPISCLLDRRFNQLSHGAYLPRIKICFPFDESKERNTFCLHSTSKHLN